MLDPGFLVCWSHTNVFSVGVNVFSVGKPVYRLYFSPDRVDRTEFNPMSEGHPQTLTICGIGSQHGLDQLAVHPVRSCPFPRSDSFSRLPNRRMRIISLEIQIINASIVFSSVGPIFWAAATMSSIR